MDAGLLSNYRNAFAPGCSHIGDYVVPCCGSCCSYRPHHRICHNGRDGSNDNDKVETITTTTAAADVTVDSANVTTAVIAAAAGVNLASSVAAAITLTLQDAEAPVDVTCWCGKRRHNNQLVERHKRGRL